MFTGIIEETGIIKSIVKGTGSATLTIAAAVVLEDVRIGDSIAVNGVCLTVTSYQAGTFKADVMHETLRRSGLGRLTGQSRVNLERAMPANGRFGGHIVSGHIDGTGVVQEVKNDGIAIWYTIGAGADLLRYIVEKGSIAVDGISLTVAEANSRSFRVSVIPHTTQMTTLRDRKSGDTVNLETDCIGKYIEKLLGAETKEKGITQAYLQKLGY